MLVLVDSFTGRLALVLQVAQLFLVIILTLFGCKHILIWLLSCYNPDTIWLQTHPNMGIRLFNKYRHTTRQGTPTSYAAFSCRHMLVAKMADQPAASRQSCLGVSETRF